MTSHPDPGGRSTILDNQEVPVDVDAIATELNLGPVLVCYRAGDIMVRNILGRQYGGRCVSEWGRDAALDGKCSRAYAERITSCSGSIPLGKSRKNANK